MITSGNFVSSHSQCVDYWTTLVTSLVEVTIMCHMFHLCSCSWMNL